MNNERYELLDFGDGRKLERFGPVVLDRPCVAAEDVTRSRPDEWRAATARYDRTRGDEGKWKPASTFPAQWSASFTVGSQASSIVSLTFGLQASPFGHVGVFPEQQESWRWILGQVAKSQVAAGRPLKILNLFAYTGGSTLAAAAAGAEVMHVDAARNIVERARQNASLSGLADRPIRWIAEDSMKLCRRELKRGHLYDGVILDPPSYGHGPKGEPWKIGDHLLPLLRMCGELTADHRALVLATCHTPGIGPAELGAYVAEGIFGNCAQPPAAGQLTLNTSDGRPLFSGVFARWPATK